MSIFNRDVMKQRRRYVRARRIEEIREVEEVIILQGEHSRVSPVVARWFRRKGFTANPLGIGTVWAVRTKRR